MTFLFQLNISVLLFLCEYCETRPIVLAQHQDTKPPPTSHLTVPLLVLHERHSSPQYRRSPSSSSFAINHPAKWCLLLRRGPQSSRMVRTSSPLKHRAYHEALTPQPKGIFANISPIQTRQTRFQSASSCSMKSTEDVLSNPRETPSPAASLAVHIQLQSRLTVSSCSRDPCRRNLDGSRTRARNGTK